MHTEPEKDRQNGKAIRVAIAGAGIAAVSAHVPSIQRSHDYVLCGFCDRDPARIRWAEEAWKVTGYQTIEAMLQNAQADAAVIATPPDSHMELALACIEAGIHLLIEKPLAPTAVEAERIVQAANVRGVKIAVNYEKRFHPSLARVGELLRSHTIGIPYFAGIHWAATVKLAPESFIPAGFERGYRWRWSNKTIGGGIVQDHLPHYLDLFRHWTGATPISVFAHTFNVGRDYLRWSPEDSVWEDFGIVLTRFSNDLVVRLETGTTGRSLSPIWSLGSGIGEWTEYGYILGTKGQLLFDLLPWDSSENGRVVLWELDRSLASGTGWTFLEQPEPTRRDGSPAGAAQEMFSRQLREFAQFVRGESTNIAIGFDGYLGVAAVEAAYQSAKSREECRLSTMNTPAVKDEGCESEN